jgi:hypothetical protein
MTGKQLTHIALDVKLFLSTLDRQSINISVRQLCKKTPKLDKIQILVQPYC